MHLENDKDGKPRKTYRAFVSMEARRAPRGQRLRRRARLLARRRVAARDVAGAPLCGIQIFNSTSM